MEINFNHEIEKNPEPNAVGTLTFSARIFGGESDPVTFSTSCFAREYLDDDHRYDLQSRKDLYLFLSDAEISSSVKWNTLMKLTSYVATCFESTNYSPGCALHVRFDIVPDDDPAEVREPVREVGSRYSVDATGNIAFADVFLDYESENEIEEAVQEPFDGTSNIGFGDVFSDYESENEIEEAFQESFDETSNVKFKPASKLVVKSLKRKMYNEETEKENKKMKTYKEECTICLEEFKDGGRLVTLPCGHEFDEGCCVKWFEVSHLCPLCRYKLPCEDQ